MCGIAGIVKKDGFYPDTLLTMCQTIRHRGPDDEGILFGDFDYNISRFRTNDTMPELAELTHVGHLSKEEKYFVGLGFRRLSIVDLSANGHQPMSFDKFHIIFNGEIYNHIEIKNELKIYGYNFKSNTDTEVILAAYHKWGMNCVNKFVGMWSFCIFDTEKKILFISRDRFGIKPFYFHFSDNTFIFSSEIKAIINSGMVERKINYKQLYQYVAFRRFDDPNSTLLNDIIELPAGNNLIFSIENWEINNTEYYNINSVIKENLTSGYDEKFLIEKHTNLLKDSINLHLRSDVPVGSCLSGGLDSSSIVAFSVNNPLINSFKTYTAAYSNPNYDESKYVNCISNSYKNIETNFTYPNFNNLWNEFDKLVWFQDLPFQSTSIYAQWDVMKLAHNNGAIVLLDGQGADEIYGGYDILIASYLYSLLKKAKLCKLFKNSMSLKKNRKLNILNSVGSVAFFDTPEYLKNIIRNRMRLASQFINTDFFSSQNNKTPDIGQSSFLNTCITSIYNTLHDLLRYEDRNSMAFSIESRVPFLDHRLVENVLSLPAELKIKNGWSKYVLRKSVENILPAEVVWRKDKIGFATPQEEWRKESGNILKNYICDYKMPDFFNKDKIIKILDKKELSKIQLNELWCLLTILKWKEIHKIEF